MIVKKIILGNGRNKYENQYGKYEIDEKGEDLDIYKMMELFQRLLLTIGFHPDTIKDGFNEMDLGEK